MKIALISYSGKPAYTPANNFSEIDDVLPFLQKKGLDIHAKIWDDPTIDWGSYDVALLKTPWDYHRKFEQFNLWLNRLEALNITMLNDYRTVRWNFDKHYLQEIADAGLAIIPSVFLNCGWVGEPDLLFQQLGCHKIIIKPCISGGSNNTFVIDRKFTAEQIHGISKLVTKVDLLAQPFLEEIKEGEWSFIFFNGVYSHTILKKPKTGDFRVQQAFGGTIEAVTPSPQLILQAGQYVTQFAQNTLYARVDGVMVDGTFKLMELELIEPFLYLSYGESAIERYYEAIESRLNNLLSGVK